MYRGRSHPHEHGYGHGHGHGHGPTRTEACRYCLQDAEFSDELGHTTEAENYEFAATSGQCMHMPAYLRQHEAYIPRGLRLHADPPGRRPRGPSHLTAPYWDLDGVSVLPPAWPEYRSEFLRQTQSGQAHHGLPPHWPGYEARNAHGPSSGDADMRGLGGRSGPGIGRIGHSHQHNHHGASDYGSSSLGESDSDFGRPSSRDSRAASSYGSRAESSNDSGAASSYGSRAGSSYDYGAASSNGSRAESWYGSAESSYDSESSGFSGGSGMGGRRGRQ